MLKRKKYLKALLIFPLVVQIILFSVNFQSNFDVNNPNYSNNNFNGISICQMKKIDIDNTKVNIPKLIDSKEISVIPEFESIFCLGKIVNVVESEKEITFYVGTNRKVFIFITLFNLVIFLLTISTLKYLNIKFLKMIILFLFISTILNINWLNPQNLPKRIALSFLLLIPLIGILEVLNIKIIYLFEYKLLTILCFTIVAYVYLEQISYTLRLNRDTFVWLNTAIRMDKLNLFEYKSTWEHKGSVIFWIYYVLVKFFRLFDNLWLNLGFVFILFNSFCSFIVYKILSKQFINRLFVLLISFLVFVNLTFSPLKTTFFGLERSYGNAFFDTRLIGSAFILFAIYYLLEKKFYYSTFYLILAVLVLPSFLISSSILFLFILLYDLKNNKQRMKLFIFSFLIASIYFLYLLLSKQLNEFFVINIKFNLLLSNVGDYYPIEIIINQNSVLFLNFLFILIYFKKLRSSYGRFYLLIFIWSLTSLIHLLATGPRWAHYETIILIPFVLCGGLLLNVVYNYINTFNLEKKQNYLKYIIITVVMGAYSIQYANDLNYTNFFSSQNESTTLIEEFNNYGIYDRKSSQFAIMLVKDSEWDYLFNNYSFVPSTRTWPTLWHKRDEGWYALYPFDRLFDEEYFKGLFFDDIKSENPIYAILDAEIKSTHNNYLYDYVLTNYTIEKCERSYCIYKLKN